MENELINTEEKQQFESKAKYADMAKKFMVMFVIQIFLICTLVISLIITFAAKSEIVLIAFGCTSFAVNIIYAIILFLLSKYDSEFGIAGLFYILETSFSILKLFLPDNSMALLMSLLNAVFSFLYLLKFTNAMSSRFLPVDASLSDSWDTYRKVNIYIIATSIGCAVLAFIPGINILAGIVAILCAIAAIGLLVWELVLQFNSSKAMKAFANKPDEPPADSASVTPLVTYENPVE